MSIVFAVAIFFVVWWIVLFAVLPFGVRTQGDAGERVPGTPDSAPVQFALGRVFLINTVVSIMVFCVIWMAIEFDWFSIGEVAKKVHERFQ